LAFDYYNKQIKFHDLVSVPKPHVAEVVICGKDMNKSKSNDHPYSWFNARFKKWESEQDQILKQIVMDETPISIPDLKEKTGEEFLEVVVKDKCHHEFRFITDGTGHMCTKCGQWFNYQNV
jgi:hypothetical protein